MAAEAHDILLHAEYILTGVPPVISWNPHSRGNINVRSNQPKDARQGIKQVNFLFLHNSCTACVDLSDARNKKISGL